MTDEQFDKAQSYIIRQAKAAGVDIRDTATVIRFILENPLPADYEAQVDTQADADKDARIERMRAQLEKLEGSRTVR
jgi:hypothetical protein